MLGGVAGCVKLCRLLLQVLLVVHVVGVELILHQKLGLLVLAALPCAALCNKWRGFGAGSQGCLTLLLDKVHVLEYGALLLWRVDEADLGLLVEAEGLLEEVLLVCRGCEKLVEVNFLLLFFFLLILRLLALCLNMQALLVVDLDMGSPLQCNIGRNIEVLSELLRHWVCGANLLQLSSCVFAAAQADSHRLIVQIWSRDRSQGD